MFKKTLAAAGLAAGLTLSAFTAQAGNQLAVAIGGYDTVSDHDGIPLQGEARFNAFHNGAVWYFSSAENRDRFKADPAAFVPAYDGYCSWVASQGYKKAPGDPNVWLVIDGTLYVQVHPRVQTLWQEDIPVYIVAGDEKWPRIRPF